MLKLWKDKKKIHATYGNLVACCLVDGGDTNTAVKICELLAKSQTGEIFSPLA